RAVERPGVADVARLWWLWLVTGIMWIVAAMVVLQFDQASVTTVSIIIGLMFAYSAVQQFVLAAVAESMKWLWIVFGVLFAAASIICFINPKNTFAGIADILGFLFLCVGVWWVIRAFVADVGGAIRWLAVTSGVLM